MDRIQLTRAEAVALLLLTGPSAERALLLHRAQAKKTFPGFARVIDSVSSKEADGAVFRLMDILKPQLAKFNEELVNKERLERERAAEAAAKDLFYKNVTGLLKKLNDTTYLIPEERLSLATARYPEADIRVNRLGKLEYFGRKTFPVTGMPRGLKELLKEKLAQPVLMPSPDKKDDFLF